MYYKQEKHKKHGKNVIKRKVFVFFTFLLVFFALFIFYMSALVTPLIVNTGKSQIKVIATKSMNFAVTEAINQNISYDDLVTTLTDSNGKIYMIEANTVKINNISNMIERVTLAHLNEIGKSPLEIPIGAFTGIALFSGMGPPVRIDLFPYGEVGCKFLSQFISAGINQTQHKIYVQVKATVNVVLPLKTFSVTMDNEVLVCESVIIGEIPETYLKSSTLQDMLDLIPG